LAFIIGVLDWEKNAGTHFKEGNYVEPIVANKGSGSISGLFMAA
jgi:hypothetical protein